MSKNFLIKNLASEDKATIDIFGDIGENWFDEGITMQSINETLKGIKANAIDVNISSLGGDFNDALVIYDLLRMHKANINVKILGLTASSGTIIAMAGDNIEISENAMFLIHNVWTMIAGNANDMRDMADEMDKFDSRAAEIYKRKTGKRTSQILSLMNEEKWLDPIEAKEFGFVDNIFKSDLKVAASIDNINIKNKFINNKKIEMEKLLSKFEDLKNFITEAFKNKDVKEDDNFDKNAINAKIEDFEKKINAFKVDESQTKADHEAEIANLKAENEKAVNALKEASDIEIEAKTKEIEALTTKISEKQAIIDKAEAGKTGKDTEDEKGIGEKGKDANTELKAQIRKIAAKNNLKV